MPRFDRFPLPLPRHAARACAATLLLTLTCGQAAADPVGMALRLPWGAPADYAGWAVPQTPSFAPGRGRDPDTPPLRGIYLAPAPGFNIGAEAGFDRRGGGLRAMVALKLEF